MIYGPWMPPGSAGHFDRQNGDLGLCFGCVWPICKTPVRTEEPLFLDGWLTRAEASGIKMLQQMAKTLAAHRSGLLAYYDAMITSGPLEGTNNKIKTMKRQAYGFRDQEFFKLKILAIHETKYA